MNHTNHVPKKEWMAYCVGALGQGMVYAIMSSYISDFYISVLKLTPLFVLLLMLLARVWDAINDPIMGYIMDHANPKNGKMKPYLIYTPIPIAILTVLLFYAPNISDTAKMIYAAVTYVAWGMIYTASDVPFWALPNALTPNADERGGIISKARTANGVGSAVPTAFFMVLGFILPKFNLSGTELEKTKYMCIALFCAIVGTEADLHLQALNAHSTDGYSLRRPVYVPGRRSARRPLQLLYRQGPDRPVRRGAGGGTARQYLAGEPRVQRGAVSSLIMWCIGYQHFWACVPFLVLSCVPCGAINVCAFAMIGDCLDYMEWKTGTRLTGMGSAIQSFVTKLGAALSTSFIILMYIIVDLDVGSINASVTANPLMMSHGVRGGIFSVVSLIPAISLLVCTIPMFFYNLTGDFREKMETELAAQREKKGITITD